MDGGAVIITDTGEHLAPATVDALREFVPDLDASGWYWHTEGMASDGMSPVTVFDAPGTGDGARMVAAGRGDRIEVGATVVGPALLKLDMVPGLAPGERVKVTLEFGQGGDSNGA